jgi:hypothetical protein
MLGKAKVMHDLALLPTQSLVSRVIGAIGVASVIGVAAKPATSGKAKEYAGYARYARRQKSSEQSNWAANSVPETRIRSFARSPPHAPSRRGPGPDLAAGITPDSPAGFRASSLETAK